MWQKIKAEPIGFFAVLLAVITSVVQSEWFDELISSEVLIEAHYTTVSDGRCSLVAFSIENPTDEAALDLRIRLNADPLITSDSEALVIADRDGALIGSNEKTPLPFRPGSDVAFTITGETIEIPMLLPGEYVDLFVGRQIDPAMNTARDALAKSEHYRDTPRIGTASHASGSIEVRNHGACISRST